jgi:hypothetical protein
MKEDVLEQIVDDFLQHRGFLTTHNIKFRPDERRRDFVKQKDSVHSDLDVVGLNPHRRGNQRVMAVSCKAWQSGFNAETKLREVERLSGGNIRKPTFLHFRELCVPKWTDAFRTVVCDRTGSETFTYAIAVTRLTGQIKDPAIAAEMWATSRVLRKALRGCRFTFLTLEDMWSDLLASSTTSVAPSEVGRLAQLLLSARLAVPPVDHTARHWSAGAVVT